MLEDTSLSPAKASIRNRLYANITLFDCSGIPLRVAEEAAG